MLITDEQTKYRIKDVLRGFIGRYGMPVETVSTFTGISVRTLWSHLDRAGPLPNAAHMACYMKLFGTLFTNAYLNIAGLGGAASLTPEKVSYYDHVVAGADAHAFSVKALKDGIIDHRESAKIIPLARQRIQGWQQVELALEHKTLVELRAA
ncbi:MAG: hypothetical protein GY832_15350 [Chloroflexi bacterium]|nr:hypothetical protein [Chloroflexota bacterium]